MFTAPPLAAVLMLLVGVAAVGEAAAQEEADWAVNVPAAVQTAAAPAALWAADTPTVASNRFGYRMERQLQVVSPAPAARTLIDIHGAPPGTPAVASVMVMGLALRTGDRSRLIWQTPVAVNTPGREGSDLARPELQLAWTLKSTDANKQFRSPLRMALSAQTVLTLKPRKSKFSVHLQHQW